MKPSPDLLGMIVLMDAGGGCRSTRPGRRPYFFRLPDELRTVWQLADVFTLVHCCVCPSC